MEGGRVNGITSEGRVNKGGRNPDNDSPLRPPAPKGVVKAREAYHEAMEALRERRQIDAEIQRAEQENARLVGELMTVAYAGEGIG